MPLRYSFYITLVLLCTAVQASPRHYTVGNDETLIEILQDKGYGDSYESLLDIIEQTVELNPNAFTYNDPDYLFPGTTIQLPKHPFARPAPEIQTTIEIPEQPVAILHIDQGQAYVNRAASRIEARSKDRLYVGDRVESGRNSVIRLKFKDDSVYILGSSSQFDINQFSYRKVRTPEDTFTARLKLLFGAITIKSGLLGKDPRDQYRFETPLASIGIRGTEYTVRYCEGANCGLYPGVSTALVNGKIDFENAAGITELNAGEFVNTQTVNQLPKIQPIPEGFLDLEASLSDLEDNRSWWQRLFDQLGL